jgi:hypothetical protein
MPRISQDNKQFYKSKIRSLLVQNPQITQREIQQRLEAEGLKLDRKYLGTLVNGIYAERVRRADTWTLNQALASFQDAMAEIVRMASEIANNPFADNKARVMALREIREAYNAVFEKLFNAGVFERKLGTIDATIRNTPLSDEKKQAIMAVFTNWGLLPAPKEGAKPADPIPAS